MMRKLAVVADYLNDSHRAHIEKMAGDAGFTVDYFTSYSPARSWGRWPSVK